MTSTLLKDLISELEARGKGLSLGITVGGSKPIFEDNKAYLIEITDVQLKETKNGFKQLEVAMSKVTDSGDLKKAGRIWLNLPIYTKTQENNYAAENFVSMKKITTENLTQFLSAALPEVFGLTAGSAKQREERFVGFIQKLQEENVIPNGIVGNRLYYVLVRGTKNPEKTYNSFFSEEPTKYPLANI